MDSKPTVPSPSSSSSSSISGGAPAQEALPGFTHEEQAALQWALEEKEREPTKVVLLLLRGGNR